MKAVDVTLRELTKGISESNVTGFLLLADQNGECHFMVNGKGTHLSQMLIGALNKDPEFIKIILTTIATKATVDKELRDFLPELITKINELKEE